MASTVPAALLAEVKETFGRVAYTHKTHEKEAEAQTRTVRHIKLANLTIIGVTAASALIAPLVGSVLAAWIAVLSALVGLVFAAFQLSFDPAGSATSHRLAAKAYLQLRNDYRALIADVDANDLTAERLRSRRDELGRRMTALEQSAAQTSPHAYEAAREALRGTEELTFSNDEYRHLL